MAKLKKNYWLKLPKDFFQSKEMKKLQKRAGGDTYVKIYLKLLLLSLTTDGQIYFEQTEDSLSEQLSIEIDETVNDIEALLLYLEHNKLLTQQNNGIFMEQIVEMIGSETVDAERKRRERNSKNIGQIPQNYGHFPPMSKNVPNIEKRRDREEIDKEVDKEIDKEIDKEKNKKKKVETSVSVSVDLKEEILKTGLGYSETLVEFLEFRKSIKKPLTALALKKVINQLQDWGYSDKEAEQCLNNSIMNGWQGIFKLDKKHSNNGNTNTSIIKNEEDRKIFHKGLSEMFPEQYKKLMEGN